MTDTPMETGRSTAVSDSSDPSERSPSAGRTVLFPVLNDSSTSNALGIAAAIAKERTATLLLLFPVTAPEQTPYELVDRTDHHRRAKQYEFRARTELDADARGLVRIGRTVDRVVSRAIDRYDADVMVLEEEADQPSLLGILRETAETRLTTLAECDVVLVTKATQLESVSSILVPVAGGPHSTLATDTAGALAREHDAPIDLLHVLEEDESNDHREEGKRYLQTNRDRLSELENVDTWLLEAPDVAEAIIEQTNYYDVTVLGAPQKTRLREFVFGSTTATVQKEASGTVLTVRRGGLDASWIDLSFGRGQ